MQRFLQFLVEEALTGRGRQIKEYTIGVSVFDKPSDFDPGTSAVVRVEAGRLRRLLAQYQSEYGADDQIRITIPKGSYIPIFDCVLPQGAPEASLPETVPQPLLPVSELAWASSSELRLVTVLTCALDDSFLSSGSLTDSDFLGSFDVVHGLCSSIAQAYGAGIDGGSSDRLIAYFGWPLPIEDAAGRALTAALEMLAAASEATQSPMTGIRIAIATSDVAVRESDGHLNSRPVIVGKAPALTMKMLHCSAFNGILVADATRRLAGSTFEFVPAGIEDASEHGLAPFWRLLRVRPDTTRFQAATGGHVSRLIGRREELTLLLSRWSLTEGSEGQAVLMIGEAGIGKSRLAEAMLEEIGEAATIMRIQCSPHHANSAFFPWIDFIRNETGLDPDSGADDPSLAEFLGRFGLDQPSNRDLLATLLSLYAAPPSSAHSGSRQKDLTFELIGRLLSAQCVSKPLVLLIEDLHWADPTTIELVNEILSGTADMRILVLMTSRPDPITSQLRQTTITSLRLPRLPKADCHALIDCMTTSIAISNNARSMILQKAEGVPLFLEELTKLILSGDVAQGRLVPLPDRLSDLLAAQFSRMGASRNIAQIASVIGRQFHIAMLAECAGVPLYIVEQVLDQLLAAGMLVRQGRDRQDTYIFRHALFRDAAYNSILLPTRKLLHGQIAEVIIESFSEIAVEQPEVVAAHFSEAGCHEEAIGFWLDAGRKAAKSYALDEAVAAFRNALSAIEQLALSAQRNERELEVLLQLGLAVRHARGYVDSELLVIYERARILATDLQLPDALASAVYGLWTHAAGLGKWKQAVEIATEFEILTRPIADNGQYALEANRLLGASAAFQGHFALARLYFTQVIENYDEKCHGPGLGYDPGAVSAAYLAWTLWHIGEIDLARNAAQEALERSVFHEHPSTSAMVHAWLIFLAICENDPDAVLKLNRQLQQMSAERECRYWQPFGRAAAAWAHFQVSPSEGHVSELLRSTKEFRERYLTSCLLLAAARMTSQLGNVAQGLALIAEAIEFIEMHDERIWEAEAYRLTAVLQIQMPIPDRVQALTMAKLALRTATRQGAGALAKRATKTLADLTQVTVTGESGNHASGGFPD